MSGRVYYEVTAEIADPAVAARWVDWMLGTHLDEVIRAGAESGRLVRLDAAPGRFVALYEFASRGALERYLREHAPRLRADGQRQFPPERVALSRCVGEFLTDPATGSCSHRPGEALE